MPLRYQIDDEHRLVLTRGYGVLTDQEIFYGIFRKLDRRSTRDVSVFRSAEEALGWLKASTKPKSRGRRSSTLGMLVLALALGTASCASTARTGDADPGPPSAGAGSGRSGDTGTGSGAAPEGPLRADESRVLGMLADPADVTPVLAPSSVAAGERFTVTITTTGSGCERLGDTGIVLGERDAVIYVYDFTSANRPGIACTMIFKHLKREIPMTFHQPGEAVIRVWGRRSKPDAVPGGEPFVIERRVQVRG